MKTLLVAMLLTVATSAAAAPIGRPAPDPDPLPYPNCQPGNPPTPLCPWETF